MLGGKEVEGAAEGEGVEPSSGSEVKTGGGGGGGGRAWKVCLLGGCCQSPWSCGVPEGGGTVTEPGGAGVAEGGLGCAATAAAEAVDEAEKGNL